MFRWEFFLLVRRQGQVKVKIRCVIELWRRLMQQQQQQQRLIPLALLMRSCTTSRCVFPRHPVVNSSTPAASSIHSYNPTRIHYCLVYTYNNSALVWAARGRHNMILKSPLARPMQNVVNIYCNCLMPTTHCIFCRTELQVCTS